jgi:hypothetical protein
MSIQDGTTTYRPTKVFKVACKGQMVDCDHIVLKEPKSEHAKHYLKLRQIIKKAEMDVAAWAQKNFNVEQNESDAGEVIQPFHSEHPESEEENNEALKKQIEMLQLAVEQSDRVDLGTFVELFGKMACSNTTNAIAVCNGTERLKQSSWEKMCPDDQLEMAAHWCSFFVTPSGRGQNTTEQQPDYALKAVEA